MANNIISENSAAGSDSILTTKSTHKLPAFLCIPTIIACICSPIWAGPALAEPASISIANYTDGTIVRHAVPLIRGTIADANATSITIINTSSNRSTRKLSGLACKGRFKILTELTPGPNKLVLRCGKDELALTLNYKPQTNPYIVRVFYLTDKTGGTQYQSPVENDAQDYRGKLATAMRLMQTFTAERMYDLGFGRVTFNLELDETGRVIVNELRADDAAERYHKMDGLALWDYTRRLIERKQPDRYAKNLVVPAFTRFDPNTKQTYAHTALGGGSLALFGGANLFTWPDGIAEAQKAFSDTTMIDTEEFFSDSVWRDTFWAAASTTMGAALHELGHTFDLPHSQAPHDIMTRGFDHFNRFFTLIEPPHAGQKDPYEFTDAQIARWEPPSAVWLKFNPWFAMDKKDISGANRTLVTADENLQNITIESDNGIGAVVLGPQGTAAGYVPIPQAVDDTALPTKVVVSMAEFGQYLSGESPVIRILDGFGFATAFALRDLMPNSFVRSWRFASLTAEWNDYKGFVSVDSNRLDAIAASAESNDLCQFASPFVDFLPHFPDEKRRNTAGYAVRTFTSEKNRKVKVFTGSDDALRVWLNGKLITEVAALRSAAIDSESADAEIVEGENTLLAEVSQAGGGWGLYLRIEDETAGDLTIANDGKIVELNRPSDESN